MVMKECAQTISRRKLRITSVTHARHRYRYTGLRSSGVEETELRSRTCGTFYGVHGASSTQHRCSFNQWAGGEGGQIENKAGSTTAHGDTTRIINS